MSDTTSNLTPSAPSTEPPSGPAAPAPSTSPPSGPAAPVAPAAPVPSTSPSSDATLRHSLRRFSTGLIAYGVIGLVVAAIGLGMLLYVGNRVAGLAERTTTRIDSIATTLDKTATALSDAGNTADSFAQTLDRTPPAVRQAADMVGNLEDDLLAIQGQLAAFSILGANPLSKVAEVFGSISSNIEGLDTRLTSIAESLEGNRGALLTNADSLRALGTQIQSVSDDLRSGVVKESLADVQLILTVLFVLLVAWTAVPAAGALWIGWYLRRELPESL